MANEAANQYAKAPACFLGTQCPGRNPDTKGAHRGRSVTHLGKPENNVIYTCRAGKDLLMRCDVERFVGITLLEPCETGLVLQGRRADGTIETVDASTTAPAPTTPSTAASMTPAPASTTASMTPAPAPTAPSTAAPALTGASMTTAPVDWSPPKSPRKLRVKWQPCTSTPCTCQEDHPSMAASCRKARSALG